MFKLNYCIVYFTTLFIGKKLDSDTQYMPKKGCMHKLPTGINDKHLHTVTFISGSHIFHSKTT
jgi:hypothetical protein